MDSWGSLARQLSPIDEFMLQESIVDGYCSAHTHIHVPSPIHKHVLTKQAEGDGTYSLVYSFNNICLVLPYTSIILGT